jgi:hypothetical protein
MSTSDGSSLEQTSLNASVPDAPANDDGTEPAKAADHHEKIVEVRRVNRHRQEIEKVLMAMRDHFESRAFAHLDSSSVFSALSPEVLHYLFLFAEEAHLAPIDRNPGGAEARRSREYATLLYGRRTAVENRLTVMPSFLDDDGAPFTAYLQPPGANPEHSEERRFQPIPDRLLKDPALVMLIEILLRMIHRRLFPDNGRGWIKVGLHLIKLSAEGELPGISSPNRTHIDGEFVTFVILLERKNVIGGESLVARREHKGQHPDEVPDRDRLYETTMTEPFEILAVDDRRVAHHVAPVFAKRNTTGHRSVLLVDFTPIYGGDTDQTLKEE